MCCWNYQTGEFLYPMIGHTNRVNSIVNTHTDYLITTSNDCTIRQWNYDTGVCSAVFKFADPVSCAIVSEEYNMLFTASWDKLIRCIDLETNKVYKSFIGSKEAIKQLQIVDGWIYVAGTDPVIRAFNLESGKTKTFTGHKGWIYSIVFNGDNMISAGDDK